MYEHSRNRRFKLIWKSIIIFDFSQRGIIEYHLTHHFKFHNDSLIRQYFFNNILTDYGLLNLVIIICAVFQIIIIANRLYNGIKILMKMKKKLNKVKYKEEESLYKAKRSLLNITSSSTYKEKKQRRSKWDMIRSKDKRKFFNIWYFILISANFFQIMTSVNHFLFPILNKTNQFLLGMSSLLTWAGCGYIFEHKSEYSFFYLTIRKSLGTNLKFFLFFFLIFIGFGLLCWNIFFYSAEYYSSIHMTFITCFSAMFGDSNFILINPLWNEIL